MILLGSTKKSRSKKPSSGDTVILENGAHRVIAGYIIESKTILYLASASYPNSNHDPCLEYIELSARDYKVLETEEPPDRRGFPPVHWIKKRQFVKFRVDFAWSSGGTYQIIGARSAQEARNLALYRIGTALLNIKNQSSAAIVVEAKKACVQYARIHTYRDDLLCVRLV